MTSNTARDPTSTSVGVRPHLPCSNRPAAAAVNRCLSAVPLLLGAEPTPRPQPLVCEPVLMENLTEMLTAAIVESARAASVHGGVAGYALIFDADMVSIYGASMSTELARDPANERLLFSPVDWPPTRPSHLFRAASELLAQLPGSSYEVRARAAVNAMVDALERTRAHEPSLREAVLLIVCADGGGDWGGLEAEAIRKLNGQAVHDQWARSIEALQSSDRRR